MRYDQLEHAIRAACDVSGDTELWIFGSQAVLGSLHEAPSSLRTSIELDVQAKNLPQRTDLIDGALGEDSLFHTAHGFYVHGVSIDSATLPTGWQDRAVAISHPIGTKGYTGHCLEIHDLAASKLSAGRDKDRTFVTTMLIEQLVDVDVLIDRISVLPIAAKRRANLTRWVGLTARSID